MQIYPVDREWVFTYVLEPFEQGCELINLFWNGVDRSLERNALSWGDRVIYLIEGALLLIPMINTIIWLAFKTFLHMETLADPFCPEPEFEMPASPPPNPELIIHRSEEEERAYPTQQFRFSESASGESTTYVNWSLEPIPNGMVVNQAAHSSSSTTPTFSSTATYDSQCVLTEYHYVEELKAYDVLRTDLSQSTQIELHARLGNRSPAQRTVFELPTGARWIQQRTVGFRPFVESNDQHIEFYTVIPEYPTVLNYLPGFDRAPCIAKFKAEKMGLEEVPQMGRLLKIVATSTRGWPYNLFSSTLWFDPVNGKLMKFLDQGPWPISARQGTYVQNSQ